MEQNNLDDESMLAEFEEAYSRLSFSDDFIFICRFDPFDRNRCVYSFENICREDSEMFLNDGRKIFFFNTKGDHNGVSQELADFLDYIETGKTKSKFTDQIDRAVKLAN